MRDWKHEADKIKNSPKYKYYIISDLVVYTAFILFVAIWIIKYCILGIYGW